MTWYAFCSNLHASLASPVFPTGCMDARSTDHKTTDVEVKLHNYSIYFSGVSIIGHIIVVSAVVKYNRLRHSMGLLQCHAALFVRITTGFSFCANLPDSQSLFPLKGHDDSTPIIPSLISFIKPLSLHS